MRFSFIFSLIFICIFGSQVSAFKNNKLEITGTIIADEAFYGHIYDDSKVQNSLQIVRIDEVLKGEIDSKYILVNYYWRLKDKIMLSNNKYYQWKFNLTREKSCNSTLEKLQFIMFGEGERSGIMPRFIRTWGIRPETPLFNETLLCYKLKQDNFSPVETSLITEKDEPKTDTEYYFLENERWLNLPETPLKISLFSGNLSFTNIAEKQIIEYQLGCIAEDNGELKITDKLTSVKCKINPKQEHWVISSIGTDEHTRQLRVCYDKKSKLSVIEVSFEDNSMWQAK